MLRELERDAIELLSLSPRPTPRRASEFVRILPDRSVVELDRVTLSEGSDPEAEPDI